MQRSRLVALHDDLRKRADEQFRLHSRHGDNWLAAGRRYWREGMRLDAEADAIAARLVMMDDGPGIIAAAQAEVL